MNLSRAELLGLFWAPLPLFLLMALVLVWPALGAVDMLLSIGIAFVASYGVMLLAGLPLHLLLRSRDVTARGYQLAAIAVAWIILFAFEALDGHEPSSAFALLLSAALAAAAAAFTAGLFCLIVDRADRRG